jgi:hypothetical protein
MTSSPRGCFLQTLVVNTGSVAFVPNVRTEKATTSVVDVHPAGRLRGSFSRVLYMAPECAVGVLVGRRTGRLFYHLCRGGRLERNGRYSLQDTGHNIE